MIVKKVNILSVLSNLFSGFSFRGKIENRMDGDLWVVQMKDLEDRYSRIGSGLTRIDSSNIASKYLLKQNDILFLSKGSNNFAIEYQPNWPKAIAASAFFVLRSDPSKIVPGYLAWYINQPPVQQYLKENMAGTYIPNINKSTIEGIQVVLPSLALQKKIVDLDDLRKREYYLMNEIIRKREAVISNTLLQIVND